jgi:adenylate kinase
MKYSTVLLFGAPGSGKGTQGSVLGKVPGFIHISTGDLFRNLPVGSQLGRLFLEYSAKGELVPDKFTVQLWQEYVLKLEQHGRFDPSVETLILDGIPRTVVQAEMLDDYINVNRIYYLDCSDKAVMLLRLQKRALIENRLDDASVETINNRLRSYEAETFPVLSHYADSVIRRIDTARSPVEVLAEIVSDMARIGTGTSKAQD